MKGWQIAVLAVLGLLAVLLLVWLVTNIGSGATPPPTEEVLADYCTRYQTSEVLLIGTSADYPPFAFYDDDFQLAGFDVELIRAIGQKMGKQVQISDMAFDGLGTALQIGQIDAAIAAISVTEERREQFLFSNVYLVSQGGVLAGAESTVDEITAPVQLVNLRTGVQTQSVFEGWIRNTLVEPGLMPVTNLFTYPRIDHAVEDLRQGRLDVVVLDSKPALEFANQGGVKVVGTGGSQQLYAIGLNPCAVTLQEEINRALMALSNEGVIADLTQRYLNLSPEQVLPTPTPAPTATATATPAGPTPTPTATPPGACLDGMDFVEDLTFDDEGMTNPPQFQPGEDFEKGWRLRNAGTCTWDPRYYMAPTGGNSSQASMGGKPTFIVGTVEPGKTYDLFVNLVAPQNPGTHMGFWNLFAPSNTAFGDRVWVGIEVVPANQATPTPSPDKPRIDTFQVEPASITAGQCFNLSWEVSGKVDSVELARDGSALWTNAPVRGSTEDCPSAAGDYAYRLEAKGPGGTTSSERRVQVTGAAQPTSTTVPPTATAVPPVPPFNGEDYELSRLYDAEAGLQPLIGGTEITLSLNPDLTFDGSAGCNTYSGTYQVSGSSLSLDVGTVSRMACSEPAGVMEQESAYLARLETVTGYRYAQPSLALRAPGENQDQTVMEFSR